MKKKIEIQDLCKAFGPKKVLDGLCLDVNEGEIFCILGKSGTGKSVIMKHLVGMLMPDSGKIYVDGLEYTKADDKTRTAIQDKFGILFQGAALFDSMNVYDNVAFGLRRTGVAEDEIETTVTETLKQVGLKNIEKKMPSELSGGMQKRVGLARSIVLRPEIMLYDEPTTGVDPITGGAVNTLITEMRDRYGITSIVITHDMKSASKIASRIAMLYDGKIIFTGTPEEFAVTDNAYVRQLAEGRAHGPISIQ